MLHICIIDTIILEYGAQADILTFNNSGKEPFEDRRGNVTSIISENCKCDY
jgi:hypothetical protein